MNRRGFLGSLIGSVVSLPFFARLESEEWQRVVLPYRMLIKDGESGLYVQAPGVAEINCSPATMVYEFVSENIKFERGMHVKSVVLTTESGQVIKESSMGTGVSMGPGCSLKITQCFNWDKRIRCNMPVTHEELVHFMLTDKRMCWKSTSFEADNNMLRTGQYLTDLKSVHQFPTHQFVPASI